MATCKGYAPCGLDHQHQSVRGQRLTGSFFLQTKLTSIDANHLPRRNTLGNRYQRTAEEGGYGRNLNWDGALRHAHIGAGDRNRCGARRTQFGAAAIDIVAESVRTESPRYASQSGRFCTAQGHGVPASTPICRVPPAPSTEPVVDLTVTRHGIPIGLSTRIWWLPASAT
jgi:hypothetical protein